MSDTPIYRFSGRYSQLSRYTDYSSQVDDGDTISVLASTRDEANEKAVNVLGEPVHGFTWVLIWDSIDELDTSQTKVKH